MPALCLFNRRTLVAGDDLQLPSLVWGSASAAQLFLLLPYLLYYTIELLLTTSPPEEYNNGGGGSGSSENRNDRRRGLYEVDDYFEAMESRMPSMQSSACANSTSGYTDFKFPYLILTYLLGMTIYTASSLYYEQRIFHTSSLGTPTMELQLRSAPLRDMIEFKMTWLAGYNFMLLLFGTTTTFVFIGGYTACFPTVWLIVGFVLFLTQGVQCLLIVTTLVSLWRVSPVGSSAADAMTMNMEQLSNSGFYQRHADTLHTHNNVEIAEEMWQNRCEGCCRVLAVSTCFLFGGKGIVSHAAEGGGEKFYGDIARALADYFADFGEQRGLDVVPSDVGLGFVMLRHIQAQRKMLAQRDALQQTTSNDGYGSSRSGSHNDLPLAAVSSVSARESYDNSARVVSLSPNRTTLLFRRESQSCDEQDGEECDSAIDQPAVSPNQAEEAYTSFSRTVLSPSNPNDYALLEEGARFARHQLAIYTWILYYYQFPVTGTFRLIGKSMKAKLKCNNSTVMSETNTHRSMGVRYEPCSINPDIEDGEGRGVVESNNSSDVETTTMNQETIVGDNFLHIHEASMLAHAGLEKSDIAYASFEAGFYETPYCIIIDRKWKSVVLSIRGSLTLEDCVVDVLLDPSPLDALGVKYGFDGAGQYCHGGVLECANWLHEDLMRYVSFFVCPARSVVYQLIYLS